jgi:hypothetical protein
MSEHFRKTMIPENLKNNHWNKTDWIYIQGLSKAIEKVPANYIREEGNGKFHLERVFSYELYYRWSRLLNKRNNNPEKVFLNAELVKHYDNRKQFKFPDMVLHGDYTNREKQFIICEIKSSRNQIDNNSLRKDVESLYEGVTGLSYHCAVFIYLGDRVNIIISKLRGYLHAYENYEVGRYLFIGVSGGSSNYEIL